MDESRWEKLAAGTGIVAFLLIFVSTLIAGTPPKADDPVSKIIAYGVDHRTALLTGGYLSGLAVVFALWFAGSLRSYLRQLEGGTGRLSAVAFGGGLVSGSVALAATAVGNTLSLRVVKEGDPHVVRALFDLSGALFGLLWFPAGVWVGATAVLALRNGAFPRWYGAAAGVLALIFIVAGVGSSVSAGPLSPNGGPLQLVVFTLFGLWLLLTSVLLIQRVGTRASTTG